MSQITQQQEQELQKQLLEFINYMLNPKNGFFGETNIQTLIQGLTDLNANLPQMKKLIPTEDEQNEIAKTIVFKIETQLKAKGLIE